jgi:hypothetical protein
MTYTFCANPTCVDDCTPSKEFRKLTTSQFHAAFIQACLARGIYPSLARENEEVEQAYQAKDLDKLSQALDSNF